MFRPRQLSVPARRSERQTSGERGIPPKRSPLASASTPGPCRPAQPAGSQTIGIIFACRSQMSVEAGFSPRSMSLMGDVALGRRRGTTQDFDRSRPDQLRPTSPTDGAAAQMCECRASKVPSCEAAAGRAVSRKSEILLRSARQHDASRGGRPRFLPLFDLADTTITGRVDRDRREPGLRRWPAASRRGQSPRPGWRRAMMYVVGAGLYQSARARFTATASNGKNRRYRPRTGSWRRCPRDNRTTTRVRACSGSSYRRSLRPTSAA